MNRSLRDQLRISQHNDGGQPSVSVLRLLNKRPETQESQHAIVGLKDRDSSVHIHVDATD